RSFTDRAFRIWYKVKRRFHKPSAGMTSLFPMATNYCSPALLSQCARITGYDYYVEMHAARGTFQFGHPTNLSPLNWAEALSKTLQTTPVFWLDFDTEINHHEALVFLT